MMINSCNNCFQYQWIYSFNSKNQTRLKFKIKIINKKVKKLYRINHLRYLQGCLRKCLFLNRK
jgi:hypothetical protein